jgi:hypothetical protein
MPRARNNNRLSITIPNVFQPPSKLVRGPLLQ